MLKKFLNREIPSSLSRYQRLKSSQSKKFKRHTMKKILLIKEVPNNREETEETPTKPNTFNSNNNPNSNSSNRRRRKRPSKGSTEGNSSLKIRKSIDFSMFIFYL